MLSPTVTRKLIDRWRPTTTAPTAPSGRREQLLELTDRDREIALAVAEGKANAAIAAELHLSVVTVKSHGSPVLSNSVSTTASQIAPLVQDARRS